MHRLFVYLSILILLSLACSSPILLSPQATPPPTAASTLSGPTPLPTATPTVTPIPLPTPTPLPGLRIAAGDQAIFNGEWEAAYNAYSEALRAASEIEQRGAALTGLGRIYLLQGDLSNALQMLRQAILEGEGNPLAHHRAEAYFYLGQVYEALGRPQDAADAALNYLLLRPGVLDAYIYEWRGDLATTAGDWPGALSDYQAALQSPRLSQDFSLEIKLARAYARSGDYNTAIVMYDDIYNRSSQDYNRAQLDYLKGRSYAALGQVDSANAAYLNAVNNYPANYDAYLSLVELVDAGYPVDDLQRGIVDYFAEEYGFGLVALERYLTGAPADPARAYYYRGLTLWKMGNTVDAIRAWDTVIGSYPTSSVIDRAYEMKGYTQWYNLDDYAGGYQTLSEFATLNPAHPRAAEFVFDAARAAERGGMLLEATATWQNLVKDFPGTSYAYQALFQAGLTDYRRSEFNTAIELFNRAVVRAANPHESAAALFWLGKTSQAKGEANQAEDYWDQAAAADPTGFYSERARDLLIGRAVFAPPSGFDLGYDAAAERRQAEEWLRVTFSLPAETDLSGPGQLSTDPRLQRGLEFWRLGLYTTAVTEFESLRLDLLQDPVGSYRLANQLVELGAYLPAIWASRQVLTLAGLDDAASLTAPMHFNRIRFGPYFADLVIPNAQLYNFHPLLVWSLMRQESFFDRSIRSSVGARGLMQIMPATGDEIAGRLGWPPNYDSSDLDRPAVSIRMGLSYLDAQRAYLGGDLYAALAAYNGGPGNAADWKRQVPNDPDLFLELIRLDEPKRYIRGIYEMYAIYRRLYSRSP